MQDKKVEVCVIGAGPAGSVIARRLALLGHRVCLIEQAAFPRPHIGESLPPGILPLLDFLGLRNRVEAESFLRPEGSVVRWSDAAYHLRSSSGRPGFQVCRGRFDHLLLDAARETGVEVLQPARAMQPKPPDREGEKHWQLPVQYGGDLIRIQASYLVDATGRHSILKERKRRCSVPTIALYGYWRNARIEGTETRVEAGPAEWFWGAPLPDGSFNAAVFIDPDRCRAERGKDRVSFYKSLLAGSTLLRGCLDGELVSGVKVCDASAHMTEHPVSENSIKVGEASFAIDPLSSQGVQAAINTGIQGSIVVHTILTRPENSAPAIDFYRSRQAEAVTQHKEFSRQFYAEAAVGRSHPFWQKRAATLDAAVTRRARNKDYPPLSISKRLVLSSASSITVVPCIVGDTISNMRALKHPELERPCAFLNGIDVVRLLDAIPQGGTVAEIVRKWSPHISQPEGLKMIDWMYNRGVLINI